VRNRAARPTIAVTVGAPTSASPGRLAASRAGSGRVGESVGLGAGGGVSGELGPRRGQQRDLGGYLGGQVSPGHRGMPGIQLDRGGSCRTPLLGPVEALVTV